MNYVFVIEAKRVQKSPLKIRPQTDAAEELVLIMRANAGKFAFSFPRPRQFLVAPYLESLIRRQRPKAPIAEEIEV